LGGTGAWTDVIESFTPYHKTSTSLSVNFAINSRAVSFALFADLIWEPTHFPYAGMEVIVPSDSVKFGIQVSGWPTFTALTNTLNYEIEVFTSEDFNNYLNASYFDNQLRLEGDDGAIDLPIFGIADNVAVPVNISYEIRSGRHYIVHKFPYGAVVRYDPIVWLKLNSTIFPDGFDDGPAEPAPGNPPTVPGANYTGTPDVQNPFGNAAERSSPAVAAVVAVAALLALLF
jgi:hypothetical protein